jgi:hypothetical protein
LTKITASELYREIISLHTHLFAGLFFRLEMDPSLEHRTYLMKNITLANRQFPKTKKTKWRARLLFAGSQMFRYSFFLIE